MLMIYLDYVVQDDTSADEERRRVNIYLFSSLSKVHLKLHFSSSVYIDICITILNFLTFNFPPRFRDGEKSETGERQKSIN